MLCANRWFLDAKYLVAANRRMQMIGDIYYRRWCSMRSRESEKASKLTGRNAHSPWLRRTPAAAVVALCALEECTDGILGADGRDIAHSSVIQVQVIFIVFSHSWSAVETHGLPIRKPQLAIDEWMISVRCMLFYQLDYKNVITISVRCSTILDIWDFWIILLKLSSQIRRNSTIESCERVIVVSLYLGLAYI